MAKKFTAESYRKITLDEMVEFIEENYPEDKAWFKSIAFVDVKNKNGKKDKRYVHLNAVREFCNRYAPELIPQAKPKKMTAKEKLMNW